jgi:predicted PhzF superfamily epimerase YddE/YHI9
VQHCILDRGRFWESTQPEPVILHGLKTNGEERGSGTDIRTGGRLRIKTFRGNPVAVVLDGDGLTDTDMARFATWTNLGETTYVTTPKSEATDFGLRFFSPHGELPFAGHPTLGSVHAWLESGGKPGNADVVVLECGVGLVDVRRTGHTLSFCGPALRRTGPLAD